MPSSHGQRIDGTRANARVGRISAYADPRSVEVDVSASYSHSASRISSMTQYSATLKGPYRLFGFFKCKATYSAYRVSLPRWTASVMAPYYAQKSV